MNDWTAVARVRGRGGVMVAANKLPLQTIYLIIGLHFAAIRGPRAPIEKNQTKQNNFIGGEDLLPIILTEKTWGRVPPGFN